MTVNLPIVACAFRRPATSVLIVVLAALTILLPGFTQEPVSPDKPAGEEGLITNRLEPNASAGVDPNSYQIGAGDIIGIQVWREPELNVKQTVRPDGKISMPLLGDVVATGLTPVQIREKLTAELKEYVLNPNIMVEVLQVRSKKYTITGEIGRPGSYPLTAPTTVIDALTGAGGFRDFANRKKIVIIRGEERLKFNYNDVIKGKNREQNILLQDGDLIVVP